jgi:pimeloyl-ACP methyl ester carboxylesterase
VSLAVDTVGSGPDVLLVHGGAGPRTTWRGLKPLAEHWTLRYAYRRGYGGSPEPEGGRQDFDVDAADIEPLLVGTPHLVAHSYGGLGAAIVTARRPELVRSLTLIEPPLYALSRGDADAEHLRSLGDEVLVLGERADPMRLREFLRLSGAEVSEGPLSAAVLTGVRRACGNRLASEAEPNLRAIRDAGIPVLIASGDHQPGIEVICDDLTEALAAQRLHAPGAGHFVAAAPGFREPFEDFLRRSGPPAEPGAAEA